MLFRFNFLSEIEEHVNKTDKKGRLDGCSVAIEPFVEYHENEVPDQTLHEDHLREKCACHVKRLFLKPEIQEDQNCNNLYFYK